MIDKNKEFALIGFVGMLLQAGVKYDDYNETTQTLYISVPKESHAYHELSINWTADEYVKNIKERMIDFGLLLDTIKVKYKIHDVVWTKEMGDENYSSNMKRVLQIIRSY